MQAANRNEIEEILMRGGAYSELFDLLRLVDAEKCEIMELMPDGVVNTHVSCTDIFDCNERCKNCTSIRAYYTGETVVKLEYHKGVVLLVLSVPLMMDGKRYIVEMIKDITQSMTVDYYDDTINKNVEFIISELNTLSQTDGLTGILNKRYIDEHLPISINASKAISCPLSVALFDIDLFKAINDTHGHLCGDYVLHEFAQLLQSQIKRQSDWVARYGGEEFLLCLPGAPLEDCREMVESVREKVEEHPFVYEGVPIHITVSAGVAAMESNDDMGALVKRVDHNLYEAKQRGRNQVV
ncbi:MAG: GGDEF domain-containing protein [Oscillospiraceae bacterium]|jgi:diguanylate cyclase (GGDEF)-like protein|nr:GGDEF domain-containing protein [Oscillospiraceae bacterium]